MVKKYKLDAFDSLVAKDDGYLVYYDDYLTLDLENKALKAERDALKEKLHNTVASSVKVYRWMCTWIIQELKPDATQEEIDCLISEAFNEYGNIQS